MAGAVVSRAAVAQTSVSATSGSPAAIAHIRAVVDSVERSVSRYRQTTHELEGFSLEGGEVRGFYEGTQLRKLTARYYGETYRTTEKYYFTAGEPVFIFVVWERYDRPMSGRAAVRQEHRFYLASGQPIRIIRSETLKNANYESDVDFDVAELLSDLKPLMACAADPKKGARACTHD
jgi:hypothetical protein